MTLPLILALLLTAPSASAPDDSKTCGSCKDTGTKECSKHKKKERGLESADGYCSHVIDCRHCEGTLKIDCKQCDIGDRYLSSLKEDNQRWLESMAPHFEKCGTDDFLIVQTEHFLVFWEGEGVSAKGGRTSRHGAAHLYADRLEQLYEDFKKITGADDAAFSTRFHVMVWDRPKYHRNAAMEYCAQPNPNTGVKRMGAVGIYSVFLDPAEVDPDESHGADLYRNILHNVSHLLLANAWNGIAPRETNGGWIDAGVAHYFEMSLDNRCTNFCYREQDTHASYKSGWWRSAIKKLAKKKDRPAFADTANKRTTQLTPEEHALSWSYCDFLISTNPEGFGKLCRAIKEGKGYRDALKEHFGLNALTFDAAWQEHVKTYRGR